MALLKLLRSLATMLRRRKHHDSKEVEKSMEDKKEHQEKEKAAAEQKLSQTTEEQVKDDQTASRMFVTEVVGQNDQAPSATETPLASDAHLNMPEIPDRSEEMKDVLLGDGDITTKRSKAIPFLIAVCIILAGSAGYFSFKQNEAQRELANMKREGIAQLTTKQDQSTLEKIGKLTEIPGGEQTLVTTVTNAARFKELYPLFKDARDDDKLVIVGKKAILYRESDDRIITTGSAAFLTAPSATTSATKTAEKLRVILRNGTTINGLTKRYEDKLKKDGINITVVKRENAKKQDYETTFIVDVKGTLENQAEELASALDIQTNELPDDETKPTDADLVIILGSDAE